VGAVCRRGGTPPPPRTKWTRRVPYPVLIGHAASLTQVEMPEPKKNTAARGKGKKGKKRAGGKRAARATTATDAPPPPPGDAVLEPEAAAEQAINVYTS